jgi:hypothetical protein
LTNTSNRYSFRNVRSPPGAVASARSCGGGNVVRDLLSALAGSNRPADLRAGDAARRAFRMPSALGRAGLPGILLGLARFRAAGDHGDAAAGGELARMRGRSSCWRRSALRWGWVQLRAIPAPHNKSCCSATPRRTQPLSFIRAAEFVRHVSRLRNLCDDKDGPRVAPFARGPRRDKRVKAYVQSRRGSVEVDVGELAPADHARDGVFEARDQKDPGDFLKNPPARPFGEWQRVPLRWRRSSGRAPTNELSILTYSGCDRTVRRGQ